MLPLHMCQTDALSRAQKLLAVADWALLSYEMFLTPQNLDFPTTRNAMKLSYLAIPVWGAAMTCIKISVALSLLRIPVNRLWTVFLWTVTAVQVSYLIGNTVLTFLYCQPIAAVWDFTITNAYCLPASASLIASNVGSAINITTDLLLSLAPMVMLWNLHRPLRERVLVCCLMGMGLLASASCIAKAVIVRDWGRTDIDTWALAMSIATWTMVEQLLAVIAACSPSLKGPLERALRRFGVAIVHYNSQLSFVPERWLEGRGGPRRGDLDTDIGPDLESPRPAHIHGGVDMEKVDSSSSTSGPLGSESSGRGRRGT